MKKTIVITLLTALCMCACGGGSTSGSSTTVESTSETSVTESLETETQKPIEVESVGVSAIPEASNVSETEYIGYVEDGVYVIEECKTTEEKLVVPDEINGAPVGIIEDSAFMGLEMKSVVLPDTVTYIGTSAFLKCKNLEEIELGTGLLVIGQSAFQLCPKLLTVTFPEGMTTFEGNPFNGNDNLGEVYIPSSVINVKRIALPAQCPKMVVVTPSGSKAEEVALAAGLPVKNI